jgi:hypothetical protein
MDHELWLRKREAIEARLRENLEAARSKHDLAKKESAELEKLARGIGLDHADGAFAPYKATSIHNAALREYRKALEQFCDFILHGRVPPGFTDEDPEGGESQDQKRRR